MSRKFFGIEKGIDIYAENGSAQVRILTGTAVPDGLGDQSSAPIGSLYIRSGTGEIYQKIANAGNSSDYLLNGAGSATIGIWRPEKVKVVTNDTVSVGIRDLTASPFADDGGTLVLATDFAVNDHIIADADGTPVLLKVTNVNGPDEITVAAADTALVAQDTFVTEIYLPDTDSSQENKAIVNYNGTVIVKLADIDWSLATGINLSGTYAASSGNVAASDSVETAIAKLDGVNDNQDTLLGMAQGSTNLGTWSSPVDLLFSATTTVKALFQRIGDLLMQLRGVEVTGITTAATVDSVPVASVKCVKWLCSAFEEATPANRKAFEVFAVNDGTNVDDNQSSILKLGGAFNLTITVDISGGNMRLRAASTSAGVTVTVRRIEVVKSVL
jgi:hypothetical protein